MTVLWTLASAISESIPVTIGGAVIGTVWGFLLGFVATRLRRKDSRRAALANGSAFLAALMAGVLLGGSVFDIMLLTASSRSVPALFTQFQSPVFDAPNLFFIIFNTMLEAVLIPLALFFNWHDPRRRRLMAVAAVLYYLQRAWTYFYFIPNVYEFTTTPVGGPYPAELVEHVMLWINLSWIRSMADALLFIFFLLAAVEPIKRRARETGSKPVNVSG